jgi:hypothetical protein
MSLNTAADPTIALITAVHDALADPQQVLARLSLYESAEVKGRHTEYEMSILRYALAGYLTGVLGEITDEPVTIDPYDADVDIVWENNADGDNGTITIEYPAWLATFFEDDTHFEYLKPDNTIGLAEILFEMQTQVGASTIPFIDVPDRAEVETDDDAEAETPQGDDPGSESSETEFVDPNPELDLGKIHA